MKLQIPDWIHYSCSGCGLCCRRGFEIACTSSEQIRLLSTDWKHRYPELTSLKLFVPIGGGRVRLGINEQGRCVFLRPDERCLIHAEDGYAAKPLTCRLYPHVFIPTYNGIRVSMLFSCPSVMKNEGEPLKQQEPALRELWKSLCADTPAPVIPEDTAFDRKRPISYLLLDKLEAFFLSALDDADLPLVRRILYICDVLDHLDACEQEEVFAGDAFEEYLSHYRDRLRENAANRGLSYVSLGFFESILLRMCQGLSVSLEESGLIKPSFWARQQARKVRLAAMLRYLWGRGRIPGVSSERLFAQAWAVRVHPLSTESEELIGRYLKTRIFGRVYFGLPGWGLPVLHGLRMTFLLPAFVLWHARVLAAAAGRQHVSPDDVQGGIMLVDHAFGHMEGLRTGTGQYSLQTVTRTGWAQKALLFTLLGKEQR